MRRLSAALVFAVCMSAAYHASAHTTLDQPTPSPPPSLAAGAAFDGAHGALVVVGGASPASPAETWIWSGARWRQVTEPGPSPRAEPLLAYASNRSRVVLFGGDRGGGAPPLSDTWEWDGSRWQRVDTIGPPSRSGAAMAYDARRGRVVLFGGASLASGTPETLGDTWEWDGRAWRRIDVTGPGARDHVAIVYSPERRSIVLHGGGTPSAGMLGDTWRYDGRAWTKLLDSGPARGRHRLVYDPTKATVLLYGGYDGRRRTSELWALRADAWERITP